MYNNIYFIGIGGIGMSAIARYYKFKGFKVSGYDKTPSDLTRELEKEGIPVHYTDDVAKIPSNVKDTLVVYTPAIPADLQELQFVFENGYNVLKRSRMLGEITKGQKCLAVAGTHGKTTTSTMVAHILTESGSGCSAFLGGISKNYNTNMLVSTVPTVVVEADEFDRSFHQLHPEITVITAMDADHLDIYGDLEHVHEAFRIYASQVSGAIVLKYGLPISSEDTKAKIYTYSYDDKRADFHAENMTIDNLGHCTYDLVTPDGVIEGIKVGTVGWVNVENSVAAAAECLLYGVEPEAIKHAILTFQGAKRRLDVHFNNGELTYIDDYAHHPQELATAISSLRGIFPGRRLTAIFQPHLYTRTRDLAEGFAEALSAVDRLFLLDIYPAREKPIPGVTTKIIFDKVNGPEKAMVKKADLLAVLDGSAKTVPEHVEGLSKGDVLVTFGAGDIDKFIEPITELVSNICR